MPKTKKEAQAPETVETETPKQEEVATPTNEVVTTEVVEKLATVMAENAPKAIEALKGISAATFLTPEVTAQLLKLGTTVGVASLDAGLVSLNDNIATVDVGSWKPLVVTMVNVLVREARNALHGGLVKDGGTSPVDPAPSEPEVKVS